MALGDLVVRPASATAAVQQWLSRALRRWPDAAAIAAFLAAAIVVDHDLLTTGDYPSGEWGEWLGHAYRVQLVRESGLATWDHAWAGGISPFQTYQFVPHVAAALLAGLADASTGRTMLVWEALLLFWIRGSGFVTTRLLGLPFVPALFAGVITFGAYNYIAEVLTFTTLWGLAAVPLLLVAVWRSRDLSASHLVALAAGLSIYVHPHAALFGAIALTAALLTSPTMHNLRRFALHLIVFGLATAFFWMPVLFSAKPPMQDPESANAPFLRGIFEGNIERINDLNWIIVPLVGVSLLLCWRQVHRPLIRYAGVITAIAIFLIALSYAAVGPEPVRLMQSVRLVNLLPITLGLMAAIAADAVLRSAPCSVATKVALPAGAAVVAALVFVPMFRFATDRDYEPAWSRSDAVSDWLAAPDSGEPGLVWMDGRETSWYTFHDFGGLRSARSAFPQGDWSLLARPLQEGVLVGNPDWKTTEGYAMAMGIAYLYLPDNSAAGRFLRDGGDGRYREVLHVEGFPSETLYRTPWTAVNAFVADTDAFPKIEFPRGRYKSDDERSERDWLVAQYAQLAYSAGAAPVRVEYPTATTMRVRADDLTPGQRLIIVENWDRSWHAQTSDGQQLDVSRYGPNYIAVNVSGLSGDVVIELRHEMSWDWKAGIALSLLAAPMAVGLALWERRRLPS